MTCENAQRYRRQPYIGGELRYLALISVSGDDPTESQKSAEVCRGATRLGGAQKSLLLGRVRGSVSGCALESVRNATAKNLVRELNQFLI